EPASPWSRRAATTRSPSAWTLAFASSGVCPYVSVPGSSRTSAIQRPSSSCSISTVNVIGTPPSLPSHTILLPSLLGEKSQPRSHLLCGHLGQGLCLRR